MDVHVLGAARGAGRCRWNQRGFTLIELMITVAVLAILSTIAYASYQSFVLKSRRAAAATCLQERAQFMERYYTTHLTYATAPNPPAQCDSEVSPFYAVSFAVDPTAKDYTLQAAPQGAQLKDTKCGTLTLTAKGVRGTSVSGTSASDCW